MYISVLGTATLQQQQHGLRGHAQQALQQGHQTQGPQIMQGPGSMIEPGLPQPSIQGPGTQLPPYQYPPGIQINLLNLINNPSMFNGAIFDLAKKPYIPQKILLQ